MQHKVEVAIIGTGFGGQCAAINLRKQGVDDFVMLERRSFAGGTWAQNTYPGAAVDVQSPLYSLSFEYYDWSQMFAEQHELKAYTEHVFNKYQLHQHCRLNANVDSIEWQAEDNCWKIEFKEQQPLFARTVINASGPLSTPVIPNFPGKDNFKGISFHTNNWDHTVDLSGKKVAIIGSGASAAQIIPAIIDKVGQLNVFQRTPHWVLPRPDYKFKSWQRKLLTLKPIHWLLRNVIYWGLEYRVLGLKYSKKVLDIFAGNQARRYLKKQVADPELRAKLTPDFTIGCKRVILSSTLYPALQRGNCRLLDKHQGIAQITESGIETTEGEHIDLDVIIYSTGYDATDGVISYPVKGKHGKLLSDFWQPFPRAYLGTSVPNFPNFFVVTGPNTGIGHTSALFVIESQMLYIMQAIKLLKEKPQATIEVTPKAEQDYTDHIHQEMERTVWKSGGCSSWYQSKSGHVIAMYPGFSFTFRRLAKHFKLTDHTLNQE